MKRSLFILIMPVMLFITNLYLIDAFKDSKFDDFLIFSYDYMILTAIYLFISSIKKGYKELSIKQKFKDDIFLFIPVSFVIFQINYTYYEWNIFQWISLFVFIVLILAALAISWFITIYKIFKEAIIIEIKNNKNKSTKVFENITNKNEDKIVIIFSDIISFFVKKKKVYSTKQLRIPPLSF